MGYHTVNFSDVDSFEPLPNGEYAVEIDKVEVRKAKDGESLYLNFELIVLDSDYENRRLWTIRSMKETAAFYFQQAMIDLGVIDSEDEEIRLLDDDEMEPTSKAGPRLLEPNLEGLEAIATVTQEVYDGKIQNRVTALVAEDVKPKHGRKKSSAVSNTTRKDSRRSRDEDYDDEPRKRSRRHEEDEDEAPRQQRAPRSQGRSGGRRRVR